MSDGAGVVYVDGYVNKEGDKLPLLVQKSDGGFMYSTTDLAAIRHRQMHMPCSTSTAP